MSEPWDEYANMRRSCIVVAAILTACAAPGTDGLGIAREQLAPDGKLRVGIIVGPNASPFSAVEGGAGGRPQGVTVALAESLAQRFNVPLALVSYPSAEALGNSASSGQWDVTYMAVNAERAKQIAFGSRYVISSNTHLVPDESRIGAVSDIDSDGVRVVAQSGSSSVLTLRNLLKRATLLEASSLTQAYEMLDTGRADAIAGAKQTLMSLAEKHPGARVLEQGFSTSFGAVGVPLSRAAVLPQVSSFTEEAKRAGVVQRALAAQMLTGATVAPAENQP